MQRNTQRVVKSVCQSLQQCHKRYIQLSATRQRSYWAESRSSQPGPLSHVTTANIQTRPSVKPHSEARGIVQNQTIVGDHFVEQKFVDCQLRDGIFENCTFERCQMTGGSYHLCHAESTKFLGGAFDCCTLTACTFVGGEFTRSNLQQCTTVGGNFIHCVRDVEPVDQVSVNL